MSAKKCLKCGDWAVVMRGSNGCLICIGCARSPAQCTCRRAASYHWQHTLRVAAGRIEQADGATPLVAALRGIASHMDRLLEELGKPVESIISSYPDHPTVGSLTPCGICGAAGHSVEACPRQAKELAR